MDKIMCLIELLDDECNFYTCQAVVIRLRDMVCEWVNQARKGVVNSTPSFFFLVPPHAFPPF